MPRDLGIADRLRAEGLNVVEVDGWLTRGSDSLSPRGSVDHHTAGARTGNAPSLGVCINGRAGVPGPLCNVFVARDNTCYVVAAGRANHAGKGGWRGLSGNSSVYGVERENIGTAAEPWRADQTTTAARVHVALIRGTANPMPALVAQHKEWAPGRKSDAHSLDGDTFRNLVDAYLHDDPPPNPAPQPEDADMEIIIPVNDAGQPDPDAVWLRVGNRLQHLKPPELAAYRKAKVKEVELDPEAFYLLRNGGLVDVIERQ